MEIFRGFLKRELQQESRSKRDVKHKTQVGYWFEFYGATGIAHLMLKFSQGAGEATQNWRFLRREIATTKIKMYKKCETERKVKDLGTNFIKLLELTISFLVALRVKTEPC